MILLFLIALPATGASNASFHALPVQTDSYCSRGYPICSYSLFCLDGYSLECKSIACGEQQTCEDFGSTFRASQSNGHCDWAGVANRYDCCECVGPEPPAETTSPTSSVTRCYDSSYRCPDSYSASCCYTGLSCPDGYILSEPVGLCERTECGLEGYVVSELNHMSSKCHGIFPGDQVQCQTCVKVEGPSTILVSTTTTTTTTTTTAGEARSDYSAVLRGEDCDGPCLTCPTAYQLQCVEMSCNQSQTCEALGDFYVARGQCAEGNSECCRCARSVPSTAEWELVGTPGNGACRGRNSSDNSASYYWIQRGITDLEDCKSLCLQHFPSCKGIEYSRGRCEIWTRPAGIFSHAELNMSGFTCMRFGWAARHLMPVDGGTGRACRGPSGDSRDSYYVVAKAEELEECKAMCTAAPLCTGIEFSQGRCEIWTSPIGHSKELPNFSCFAYSHGGVPIFTEKSMLIP